MEEVQQKEIPKKVSEEKKVLPGGKWFRKIPKDILLSPGGVILIFFALFTEIVDFLIPPHLLDSLVIELFLELPFCLMLKIIAGIPLTSMVFPLILERFDILGIIPTWFVWLLRTFF